MGTGTWLDDMTFHILGIMIPTDEVIFFRGVGQPPTRFLDVGSSTSKKRPCLKMRKFTLSTWAVARKVVHLKIPQLAEFIWVIPQNPSKSGNQLGNIWVPQDQLGGKKCWGKKAGAFLGIEMARADYLNDESLKMFKMYIVIIESPGIYWVFSPEYPLVN